MEFARGELSHLRARVALAQALTANAPRALWAEVERCVAQIEGTALPWSPPLARTLRAGLRWQRGDRPGAQAELALALGAYRTVEMHLHAEALEVLLAELGPSVEAEARAQVARGWLRDHGVDALSPLGLALLPGLPSIRG
jgi:hypothetical protein